MHNYTSLGNRLADEVSRGQAALKGLAPAVSIFGGARVTEDHRFYADARLVARHLAQAGHPVITGGGPGVMEAANKGAREGRAPSIGLTIQLPFEEKPNPNLDIHVHFRHLASRKVVFCRHSAAFVFFPGGFGTLDELGEILCLLVTEKQPRSPVIFYESAYWNGLLEWINAQMVNEHLVDERWVQDFIIADTPEHVVQAIGRALAPAEA